MVLALAGGEVLEGAIDEIAVPTEPTVVELPDRETERILGPGFEPAYVTSILDRLGLRVDGNDPMRVTVPTFRPDLTRPADLIEEVARIHGFDKFEATLPTGPAGGLTDEQRRLRLLNATLVGIGLNQAINLPFVSVGELKALGHETDGSDLLTVKNPLREEESLLRPSLLPGLLNDLRYNRSHGILDVTLFEAGTVFSSTPDSDDPRLPLQFDRLAWALVGEIGMGVLGADSLRADGAISLAIWRHLAETLGIGATIGAAEAPGFHPGRTAAISVDGAVIGYVGELSPIAARAFDIDTRVAVAEIDLAPLLRTRPRPEFKVPSTYPHVDFDLSFLVTEATEAGDLVAATSSAAGTFLESAQVFDEFRDASLGEGMKAIAITYRVRAPDRTLDASEIAAVCGAMIKAGEKLGARLRGA